MSLLLLLILVAFADAPSFDARRDALTHYGLGLLRARNDLPVQAVKQFEAAVKADPTSPAPHRELVKLYADLGRYPAAIRAAKRALELDPDDADTAQALGKLLYDGKKYVEAAAALKQAADSPRAGPVKRFGMLRDLARAHEASRNWASAEAALRAALVVATGQRATLLKAAAYSTPADLDRSIAGVHERLGQALTEQRKFAEASIEFRDASKQFADAGAPEAAARIGWNLSGLLAAEGKVEEALTQLDAFLKLKPNGAAPYERYAALLRRANRAREVPGALARMAEANPSNEAIRWVLATEFGKDDPTAAERLFHEAAERTSDPGLFRAWVQYLKSTNRYDRLLAVADELYQAARGGRNDDEVPEPTRPDADPKAVARAQAFTEAIRAEPGLSTGLIRRATDDLERNAPHMNDTWELIAAMAERAGRLDLVESAYQHAARRGSPALIVRYLSVLARQRKWDTVKTVAREAIQSAVRNRPYSYDVYLAAAYAELGLGNEALAALKILPDETWARLQKARILNILDRHEEAVTLCQDTLKVAKNPSELADVHVQLSNSYLGLKKYSEAETALRAILDEDPDNALALNNLGYNLADQGRNLAEAEELIRRAIALDQDELLRRGSPEAEKGTYLDSLGWVLFRRGKLTEARDLLEKASQASDSASDAIVWDHLGDVRFRLGDRAKAGEAWGKASELYVGSHQGRQQGRLDEVRRKLKQAE